MLKKKKAEDTAPLAKTSVDDVEYLNDMLKRTDEAIEKESATLAQRDLNRLKNKRLTIAALIKLA